MTKHTQLPRAGLLAFSLFLVAAPISACNDMLTEQPRDRISTE